jgi:hypothetical protein
VIPINQPLLIGNELKYLTECIETGWISSEGPFVRRLEEGMAKVTDEVVTSEEFMTGRLPSLSTWSVFYVLRKLALP